MRDEISQVRASLQAAENTLYAQKNRQRARQAQLTQARRRGPGAVDQVTALEQELAGLNRFIERTQSNRQALLQQLAGLVGQLVLPQSPQQLASQLDDSLPCLLFPVRIETRFMGAAGARELWVRVFPDDVAVHTHEPALTRDEAASGVDYWTQQTLAGAVEDAAERERLRQGAWRALVNSYGRTRAAWIVSELKRGALEREGNADMAFLLLRVQIAQILDNAQAAPAEKRSAIMAPLDTAHPLAALVRDRVLALIQADAQLLDETRRAIRQAVDEGVLTYLGFGPDDFKPESWSRAPRTEIMPDRFVLIGFTNGIKLEQPFPNAVPNPLIVGPDPQALGDELAQRDGDLVLGEAFAWIGDFEKAITVGMAMRLPLPEPFASQGFDRLLVLGLRVSSSPAEHAALLEDLLDNHHYAPEGMSFVPQGTPTNNTDDQRAGFSSAEADGDAGFALETQGLGLQATDDDLKKTDAQRLAEALDLGLDRLNSLAHADGQDVAEAKQMNRALWPATLGYFLEELLELQPAVIGRIRTFFAAAVLARGSLPALRVGRQPYGVLVTSAFQKWQVNEKVDGSEAAFLRQVYDVLKKVETQWQALVGQVSHIDAPGDSFAHLLNMLGLQASSVDFARRIGTYQTALWNLAHFYIGGNITSTDPLVRYFQEITSRGIRLLNDLGLSFPKLPKLFGLLFSNATSGLNGPVVDDVEAAGDEVLSETAGLPARYSVASEAEEAEASEPQNYIGWLLGSDLNRLKQQSFAGPAGEPLPVPKALLYRMLHRSLLLAHYAATMDLYEQFDLVRPTVRAEEDFTNVEAGRTVTRWEFMEARVNAVMPQLGQSELAIGDFLMTPAGLEHPAAFSLAEVRDSVRSLLPLPTAVLERLLAEHIDLCSYRLDAWQTALFATRLEGLNRLRQGGVDTGERKRGLHLGAYGWLENLRPSPAPARVSPDELPEALREDGIQVVEQAGNGGYIHAPSINHAVAAAVLRNAYLTHADESNADHFAVRLSSERVRTALTFLEGVRNGQELGALLGYQFERALHDRYVVNGQALAQFILAFRKQYPLVADKITPGGDDAIDRKEAYQVVDGYALLEAVFLDDPPLQYPYGVEGLPLDPANGARQAIITEVERLQDTLDAIADLSLAESVFQVTQGNHERAGAMLKALSEGNAPPEPEIVRTPRSGVVVHHKVAIHLETGSVASPWGGPLTPRSQAAPGLNKWLGALIGPPDSLRFSLRYDLDGSIVVLSLTDLELQPIDLIYLVGDEAGAIVGNQPVNDLTELEVRIDHVYRLQRQAADPAWDASGRTRIQFMSRAGFPAADLTVRTLFEALPLLRTLRNVVTTCRPLGADDYVLPSEANASPNPAENPPGWDLDAVMQSLAQAATALQSALNRLGLLIATFPPNALNEDPVVAGDLSAIDYTAVRESLIELAGFGLPHAFPKNARLPAAGPGAPEAQQLARLRAQQALVQQAFLSHSQGASRLAQAEALRSFSDLSQAEIDRLTVLKKMEIFQQAAALLLGDAFRLMPSFAFHNRAEVDAAHAFGNGPNPDEGLLRFTQQRLQSQASGQHIQDWRALAVEEWLQGVAPVREGVGRLDQLQTHQAAFGTSELSLRPLQLPFDERAHWIAVEYPRVPAGQLDDPTAFVPAGDFLSFVRHLPAGYDSGAAQAGLLIDEWNEVIPNRIETTGIALHYNQPNTEPPQCLLLAVSPVIRGAWQWDDLVDTLVDTFDRAKQRAVEPDFLRATPYAQLLPAILSSFTSHPFGTISTNLAAQPASMIFTPEA